MEYFQKTKLMILKEINMNKQSHTYQEDFEVGVEYTYDKNYKRVYNIKKLIETD